MAANEDTIFLTIAKQTILRDLKRIQNNAVSKDNGVLSFFRGSTLSQKKQSHLESAAKEIEKISSNKFDDMKAFAQLHSILSTCLQTTSEEAGTSGKAPSSTEKSVGKTMIFLTLFYNIFLKDKESSEDRSEIYVLLNKANDNKPVNVMIYFMMQYVAYHCFRSRETPGVVKSLFISVKGYLSGDNKNILLSDNKVKAVLTSIDELLLDIDRMDSSRDDYEEGRCDAVIKSLNNLIRENKVLCHEATTGAAIPVGMSFGFVKARTQYEPTPGVLQEYAKHARDSCSAALKDIKRNQSSTACNI